MSLEHKKKIENLKKRAVLLQKARFFFDERNVSEVDPPALLSKPSIDAHIDLVPCMPFGQKRYLHTSPEYAMKRLLQQGFGDCYFLGHVYRDFEVGSRHNPEFTMAEWYRVGFSFDQIIEETAAFISLFIGEKKFEKKSYRALFSHFVGIDPLESSIEQLLLVVEKKGLHYEFNEKVETKDDLLTFLFSMLVEPYLGTETLECVMHFPATQAALAKTETIDGKLVGMRFEFFYQGVELANGYLELLDAVEQKKRFIEANSLRQKMGKEPLELDSAFLDALTKGLPDVSGVAVGFDRLVMLYCNATSLDEILPFSWGKS